MDEIICPLCGKPNPVENKYCEYCLGYLETQEFKPDGSGSAGHEQNWQGSEETPPDSRRDLEDPRSTGETEGDKGLGLELPAADTSGWMPGSSSEEQSTQDDKTPVTPFVGSAESEDSEEIPSWLNEALIEESAQADQEQDQLEITEEPAEPDEPGRVQQSPRTQESAGPLSGLSGVLSAEPSVARIRKPGAYSTKIRISDSQREHVALLQVLLEEEGSPKPLPRKNPISQQHVLRWGIAIVLLLAVFWPILLSDEQLALPVYDEGSAEVNRLVNQLPENSRVLVGVDYEPGLADELETTAAPVFNHLMNQGALFTLISTSPNGPILAVRFIQSGNLENSYINGLDYTNLGYIPGGAAGLISFIENPPGTTPYSIDGFAVWETDTGEALPPVVGINQINDYDMIVLLVDDPDLARIWIEQLSETVTDPQTLSSLVLVTSAQLEPVVRPYYESIPQPVNGLVIGLRGGAAYSRLIGGDQPPSRYWDAFGMGTFVAALLILVGSLAYYVAPELSRTVRSQEKAE